MPGYTGHTDWFELARELTDNRGVEPWAAEKTAAGFDDAAPAQDAGSSPPRLPVLAWYLAIAVFVVAFWAGIAALIWWAAA